MDSPTDANITTAIVTFLLGGGAVAVLTAVMGKKKTDAEAKLANANADHLIIGSALEFVNTLKEEISELRQSMDSLEGKIDALEKHVRIQGKLIMRLRDALSAVKPDHPILQEEVPIIEL